MTEPQDPATVSLLDSSCVSVHEIPPQPCGDCGEEGKFETHFVLLDLVNNGAATDVFRGCVDCAENFAAGVQNSLPAAEEEGP